MGPAKSDVNFLDRESNSSPDLTNRINAKKITKSSYRKINSYVCVSRKGNKGHVSK